MRTVNPENLGAVIQNELKMYSSEISQQIQTAFIEEAKALRKDIANTSPKRTGQYKKGWKLDLNKKSPFEVKATVYNKPQYRLVHLIEHGRYSNGIGARPHIFKAQEKAIAKIDRRIEDILNNR